MPTEYYLQWSEGGLPKHKDFIALNIFMAKEIALDYMKAYAIEEATLVTPVEKLKIKTEEK